MSLGIISSSSTKFTEEQVNCSNKINDSIDDGELDLSGKKKN